jgi:hypothetical protein
LIGNALNRWALLGLVACDASYGRAFASSTLRTLPDSEPEVDFLAAETLAGAGLSGRRIGNVTEIEGWKSVETVSVPGTGFSATMYQSEDKSQAIVALSGTNGLDLQDWWANVNLGVSQWRTARGAMADALSRLQNLDGAEFSGEILFTGQSLGGALAQFCLEEFLTTRQDYDPNKLRLITFNGLGSLDARSEFYGPTPSTKIAAVETAHIFVTNDFVVRLGGGHLNQAGSMYELFAHDFIDAQT